MAQLVYSAIASLDLYIEDAHGRFDWAAPDAEVHAFVNECERPVGTYLYGRRMYETMRFWQTVDPDAPAVASDYAEIWRAADKIVFSRTLDAVRTPRTRLERELSTELIQRLKATSDCDLSIGGAELAGAALAAGLVDELRLTVMPVAVGGGKAVLPAGLRLDLTLLEERRFEGGAVHLRYAIGR